ncbi:MAG: Nif3-like dinuclear metal center hexameric protein [Chloroflexota bacterium]
MVPLAAIVERLDEILGTHSFVDYPEALNGLQVTNQTDIRKIAAAVDCSVRTIESTAVCGANLLLVHHGMFWGGCQRLQGMHYRRLHGLLTNEIALYSSHLPLDAHPKFGNNILLARYLGLNATASFALFKGTPVGLRGMADVATCDLLHRADILAQTHGGKARSTPVADARRTLRWAVCSGAGASSDTLREAAAAGIDTMIVGEGPHHTAVDAQDLDIAVIYAGHYATEALGIQALAEHVATLFQLPWTFVAAPTGL